MALAQTTFMSVMIYPTGAADNQWVKVQNQRLDSAVAITETADYLVAKCKLLRYDLKSRRKSRC
jgi:hypothetical protein